MNFDLETTKFNSIYYNEITECLNSNIKADVLMQMLEDEETWIRDITQKFYNLLKTTHGQEYADEWINDKKQIDEFLFNIEQEFNGAQE
jgi:hypothetical protein